MNVSPQKRENSLSGVRTHVINNLRDESQRDRLYDQLSKVTGDYFHPSYFALENNISYQFSFCKLTTNMHQRDDSEFIDVLNNQ